eukprot:6463772-Amphidinium_carterae.1
MFVESFCQIEEAVDKLTDLRNEEKAIEETLPGLHDEEKPTDLHSEEKPGLEECLQHRRSSCLATNLSVGNQPRCALE